MKLYLNRSIAGLGEVDELVDVEDEQYAQNMVEAGHADQAGDDATDDREPTAGLGEPPAEDAAVAEQRAWADRAGIEYAPNASGKAIAKLIAEHRAGVAV